MKKIKTILPVFLMMVFVFNTFCVYAESNSVAAVDGNVTVNCTITETANKPVVMMVLPQELDTDNETDVTAVKVNNAVTVDLFNTLPIKYVSAVFADEVGKITHSFTLTDDVSTGKYSVVINYIGSENGAYVLDTFEHVGKMDIESFVEDINDCVTAKECISVIASDLYDAEESTAKEILRKSSANVDYYKTLPDESKIQEEFCQVLLGYKPADDFDISTLISSFNKACAFIKLRNDDNTLGVIGDYNGRYWNLKIGDASDFGNLSPAEQTKVLASTKIGSFTEADTLETYFESKTVVALFRETETRDELSALISETGKYASYFEKVRKILDDAELNGYELHNVYNAVLVPEKRTECEDFADIEKLFKDSIPQKNSGGGSDGGSGGSGTSRPSGSSVSSSGGIVLPSLSTVDYSTPFVDVKKTDWAYSYIKELYQNKAINGISATEFAPNAFITRQDFVKILLGVLKIEPSSNVSSFKDVVRGSYYEGYVSAAVEHGLISGIGNELFGTGNYILREDAAVIMSRVLKKYGKNASVSGAPFNDESDIALYAKEAVAHTCVEEIFAGDDRGNFNPKSKLTRAEACAILCRLADSIER